jgi:hypothetical protein
MPDPTRRLAAVADPPAAERSATPALASPIGQYDAGRRAARTVLDHAAGHRLELLTAFAAALDGEPNDVADVLAGCDADDITAGVTAAELLAEVGSRVAQGRRR